MRSWGRGALRRVSSPTRDIHSPGGDSKATGARWRGLPVFTSLHGYHRAWAWPDVLAAVTLLVIAVPEQLATSRLAGMPPITGFYAFIAGTVLFALLGSNPQMSVGADSTIAPLFAVGITRLAPTGSPHYVDLVGILAVTVGVHRRAGRPAAARLDRRVPLRADHHGLPGRRRGDHHRASAADLFGLASVGGSTCTASRRSSLTSARPTAGRSRSVPPCSRSSSRRSGSTAASRGARRPGRLDAAGRPSGLHGHGVAILGAIAHGAPRLGLSDLSFSTLGNVAPIAAVVALVVVSQSAATTRAFADQGHYEVDVGRDFVGVGAGSIAAGLLGAFPVNASPARTAATRLRRGPHAGRGPRGRRGADRADPGRRAAQGRAARDARRGADLYRHADLPHPRPGRDRPLRPLRVRPRASLRCSLSPWSASSRALASPSAWRSSTARA